MKSPNLRYKLILPLHVGGEDHATQKGKKNKRFMLNLNCYRNWHYQTLNSTKKKFRTAVSSQVQALPDLSALWGTIELKFVYYPGTRRLSDVGNIASVIEKYFCDALVEFKKLEDDNYNIIKRSIWEFGEYDKDFPRMEVFIASYQQQTKGTTHMEAQPFTPRKVTPQNKGLLPPDYDVKQRKTFMKINISETEMAEAIRNYVRGQMPCDEDDPMPVQFIAGRGENGHSAEVLVIPAVITVKSPAVPADTVPTYEAAAAAVIAKNATEQPQDTPETPETPETVSEDTKPVEAPQDTPEEPVAPETPQEPEAAPDAVAESTESPASPLSDVEDKRDEAPAADTSPAEPTTRKASSLFGGAPAAEETPKAETVGTDAPVETPAETPEAAGAPTEPATPAAAPAKEKPKSIFDDIG